MGSLVDITESDDTERVYTIGMGCLMSNLTAEEIALFEHSRKYLKEKEKIRNTYLVKSAREDFEKLSEIKDMPIEALQIISKWVHIDGFDEEED